MESPTRKFYGAKFREHGQLLCADGHVNMLTPSTKDKFLWDELVHYVGHPHLLIPCPGVGKLYVYPTEQPEGPLNEKATKLVRDHAPERYRDIPIYGDALLVTLE